MYSKAYDELYTYFCITKNFEHRQGSVYCSKEPMNTTNVLYMINELISICPWLKLCLKRMDIADVGDLHELTNIIKSR